MGDLDNTKVKCNVHSSKNKNDSVFLITNAFSECLKEKKTFQ